MNSNEEFPIMNFTIVLLIMMMEMLCAGAQSTTTINATNQDRYGSFSPVTPIIIFLLISALFIVVFFLFYICHRTGSRFTVNVIPVIAGQNEGRSRRGKRGLDPNVMETFPIFTYDAVKDHKIGKGALECAICLNEFRDDETLRLLPKCDHVFHPDCIDGWLSSHITCPVCRSDLSIPAIETPIPDQINIPIPVNESTTHLSDENDLQIATSTRVMENPKEDDQLAQGPATNQNRPPRSQFVSKFPRSHSTGHSIIQPGENLDRFTLKLPEDVRKQLINRALNRTKSLLILPSEKSSRQGYHGDGSSRGKSYKRIDSFNRWVFSKAPPFFIKQLSFRGESRRGNNNDDRAVI